MPVDKLLGVLDGPIAQALRANETTFRFVQTAVGTTSIICREIVFERTLKALLSDYFGEEKMERILLHQDLFRGLRDMVITSLAYGVLPSKEEFAYANRLAA